jgi:multidrug resistance protein
MITAFVDMVGLLMVIPLLPFYATDLGGGGLMVGVLVSAFSAAQLLSAPLWGRVSDRYGRRPALLVGLFASAIAYVVFAYAQSLTVLLLSRLVQGAGGGTVGVVQAYVADATEPQNRARSLGWLSAATNVGVTIGPLLGSASLGWGGRSAPGLMAAGLCLANMLFAWKFLPESRVVSRDETGAPPRRPREAVMRVITNPGEAAPRLIWIYAIGMGAFSGFTAVLALFLAARFGFTEHNIGYVFAWNGAISVLMRALVLGPVVDRFGEARLSRAGQALLGTGLFLVPFTWYLAGGFTTRLPSVLAGRFELEPWALAALGFAIVLGLVLLVRRNRAFGATPVLPWATGVALAGAALAFWAMRADGPLAVSVPSTIPVEWSDVALLLAISLVPVGTAFTFPCVTSLLSQVILPRERGVMMGVQQTFGGATRVLGPLWAGWSFDHIGPQYPFVTSAILVLGTIFLGLGIEARARPGPEAATAAAPSRA